MRFLALAILLALMAFFAAAELALIRLRPSRVQQLREDAVPGAQSVARLQQRLRRLLVATQLGEPQLGRRGLYHQIMGKTVANEIMLRTDILAYADGQHGISDMVELFNVPADTLRVLIDELKAHDLVREVHQSNHIRAGAAG